MLPVSNPIACAAVSYSDAAPPCVRSAQASMRICSTDRHFTSDSMLDRDGFQADLRRTGDLRAVMRTLNVLLILAISSVGLCAQSTLVGEPEYFGPTRRGSVRAIYGGPFYDGQALVNFGVNGRQHTMIVDSSSLLAERVFAPTPCIPDLGDTNLLAGNYRTFFHDGVVYGFRIEAKVVFRLDRDLRPSQIVPLPSRARNAVYDPVAGSLVFIGERLQTKIPVITYSLSRRRLDTVLFELPQEYGVTYHVLLDGRTLLKPTGSASALSRLPHFFVREPGAETFAPLSLDSADARLSEVSSAKVRYLGIGLAVAQLPTSTLVIDIAERSVTHEFDHTTHVDVVGEHHGDATEASLVVRCARVAPRPPSQFLISKAAERGFSVSHFDDSRGDRGLPAVSSEPFVLTRVGTESPALLCFYSVQYSRVNGLFATVQVAPDTWSPMGPFFVDEGNATAISSLVHMPSGAALVTVQPVSLGRVYSISDTLGLTYALPQNLEVLTSGSSERGAVIMTSASGSRGGTVVAIDPSGHPVDTTTWRARIADPRAVSIAADGSYYAYTGPLGTEFFVSLLPQISSEAIVVNGRQRDSFYLFRVEPLALGTTQNGSLRLLIRSSYYDISPGVAYKYVDEIVHINPADNSFRYFPIDSSERTFQPLWYSWCGDALVAMRMPFEVERTPVMQVRRWSESGALLEQRFDTLDSAVMQDFLASYEPYCGADGSYGALFTTPLKPPHGERYRFAVMHYSGTLDLKPMQLIIDSLPVAGLNVLAVGVADNRMFVYGDVATSRCPSGSYGISPILPFFRWEVQLAPLSSIDTPRATESPQIQVFPNPFSSQLSIDLPEIRAHDLVRVYTLTGVLFRTIPVSGLDTDAYSLDTTSWPAGVYIVQHGSAVTMVSKL